VDFWQRHPRLDRALEIGGIGTGLVLAILLGAWCVSIGVRDEWHVYNDSATKATLDGCDYDGDAVALAAEQIKVIEPVKACRVFSGGSYRACLFFPADTSQVVRLSAARSDLDQKTCRLSRRDSTETRDWSRQEVRAFAVDAAKIAGGLVGVFLVVSSIAYGRLVYRDRRDPRMQTDSP
jgi:hypothetical protein